MCDRAKCHNMLFFHAVVPDGLQFYSPNCNQVFLVPKGKIKKELYHRGGAYHDCDQCDDHLISNYQFDNGHILRCLLCGRLYRLLLLEFVHVSGKPACH